MRTPSQTAGRLRDDGVPSGPASHPRFDARNWPAMKRPGGEIKQLPAPPRPADAAPVTLRTAQNACYEALSLALKEGHVFAALTGPDGSGKTTVLEAVLSDRTDRALRCIRISDPDKVPASLAEQIESVAYAEAGKPENLERHIVLAIDDAHTASHELLLCLARLAAMREPGRRVPQILLVGHPELWDRLAASEYEVLARRLAIRAALPAAEEDADPWASIEDEVTHTMSQLRAEAEHMPTVRDQPEPVYQNDGTFERELGFTSDYEDFDRNPAMAGATDVPPPSMYALFPDPPPKASRSAARETRRRLVMPLVSLFVGLAAFAFALSLYDWPDLLGDMPWSDPKQATPFVMPRSQQADALGLPMPPSMRPAAPAPTPASPPAPTAAPTAAPTPTPAPSPVAPRPTAAQTQAPTAPPPARQIATAPPPERPIIPAVPAEKPVAPAPVVAEAPARAEPAPTPVASLPRVVSPAPAPVSAPAAPASAPPTATTRAPAIAEAPLSPAVLALLLRRGDEESAIGDISAARLLYERAAESGSGLAARQLARSYDPAFLPVAVANTLSDLGRAKQWYQRAASLGNADAATRLKALDQGR